MFVLENVKGLLSHDKGRTYQTIIDILTNGGGTLNGQMSLDVFDDGLGYHCYTQVLNTKDYGIPQNRERIFIIGFKDFRSFSFPKSEPLKLRLKHILQDNPNSKYILSEKAMEYLKRAKEERNRESHSIQDGNGISTTITSNYHKGVHNGGETYIKVDDKYYLSEKMMSYLETRKDNFNNGKINYKGENDIASAITRNSSSLDISDNIIKVTQLNPSKESQNTQPYQQNRIYDVNGLSPSLAHIKDGGNIVNTEKIRRLTPVECFSLQAFPDEQFFKAQKVCSDTQLYKQSGNSITVVVLERIFEKMFNLTENK